MTAKMKIGAAILGIGAAAAAVVFSTPGSAKELDPTWGPVAHSLDFNSEMGHDMVHAVFPCVIRKGNGFVMWYSGSNGSATDWRVIRAESTGLEDTERVLELCGLAEKVDEIAGKLSQGDKKKLELAIALASQPALLLLDEPTAGMSRDETKETMDLVDRLNRDLGLSVLFTEHDMSVIFNHAQHVTLLHRGEIIVEGAPGEVRDNETAQKIYLGEHYL